MKTVLIRVTEEEHAAWLRWMAHQWLGYEDDGLVMHDVMKKLVAAKPEPDIEVFRERLHTEFNTRVPLQTRMQSKAFHLGIDAVCNVLKNGRTNGT